VKFWYQLTDLAVVQHFFTPAMIGAVRSTAAEFGIDGRAVVGAIWWERRHNWRGVVSDVVQVPAGLHGVRIGNGLGWGSMHFEVGLSLHGSRRHDPRVEVCTRTVSSLTSCLIDPEQAVVLIAAEMDRAAAAYDEVGVNIRDRPETLAALYHMGRARERAARLAEAREEAMELAQQCLSKLPEPDPFKDEMARFVMEHLEDLAPFKPADSSNAINDFGP
jgi:hypothetical protein